MDTTALLAEARQTLVHHEAEERRHREAAARVRAAVAALEGNAPALPVVAPAVAPAPFVLPILPDVQFVPYQPPPAFPYGGGVLVSDGPPFIVTETLTSSGVLAARGRQVGCGGGVPSFAWTSLSAPEPRITS